MNSFGRIFRVHIYGESHGRVVGVLVDGCPAGLALSAADFTADLERRRGGLQKGTTPRKESDVPDLISGFFNGKTTGAPLAIQFVNEDVRSDEYEKLRNFPRPGHADLVATLKAGGFEDYRGGGHYSGRLTVAMVAAGVIARKLLDTAGVKVSARIIEVGGEKDVDAGIRKAIEARDSVGGIIECSVTGLPAGLGEPFFDSVESVISHLVFSIPAVKAIEFGAGFGAARMFGSEHNDAYVDREGRTETNNAGGVLAGLSTGNELVFRIAVKPTSSTPKEQVSINLASGKMEKMVVRGRHDLCIALRVPVVLEAAAAIALADLLLLEQRIGRIL